MSRFVSLACLCLIVSSLHAAPPAPSLHEAARQGDVLKLRALATAGANLDARDADGHTPLMVAAARADLGTLRALILLGADPELADSAGQTAVDLVPDDHEEAKPCSLMLRAAIFFKHNGRAPAGRPRQPHLVVAFEPTVNYLHPTIKKFYYANAAEQNGQAGVDDDGNGFVDDVHGWNLQQDKAHVINPLQFQIYLQSRETIARIFQQYNEHKLGRLSDDDYRKAMSGYDNPLAQIFGRGAGFTNGNFLEKALGLSHGSHVAGIIIEHSRETALLHTISWEAFGDSKELIPTTSLDEIFRKTESLPEFLDTIRQEMLATSLATGRRMSDYLRATGAGVVNMSMGSMFSGSAEQAENLAAAWLDSTGKTVDENSQEEWAKFLHQVAFEFYSARALQFLVPMVENPDVLFVVAAGNENADNDQSFQAPAYLSRFQPNVISIAAVDRDNVIAGFSNFGVRSVDLAAPGVNITSTVIPEASVLMDGTSMAAPAVAGVAAYARKQQPALTAGELKKLLLYTAQRQSSLGNFVSTGAIMDEETLAKTVATDSTTRAIGYADAAYNAATANAAYLPDHRADADALSLTAIKTSPVNGHAWWARAVTLDLAERVTEARAASEKSVVFAPTNGRHWNSLAIIADEQGDHAAVVKALTKAHELAQTDEAATDETRANFLARRAAAYLALGKKAEAKADVQAVLAKFPDAELGNELLAVAR